MTQENGYLRDKTNKIILKKGPKTPTPQQCPLHDIYATEYKDLYIAIPAINNDLWPKLEEDVDLVNFIKISDDYLAYSLERRMNEITVGMTTTLCNTFLEQGEIVPTN